MSQATLTARVASRAPARRTTTPRQLRVVPAVGGHPGSGMFAALCMMLLAGGLVSLLMLNTAMAEGSFTLHRLQGTSGELTDTEEALTQAIDAQRSPANLAARAARLGMVPAESAAFLRLSDGKVLGVASAAQKRPGFTVVTSPSAPSAKAAAKPGGPRTTVTKKGAVTTTTMVTTKPDGSVVTTVTSVNATTKATTSTTTTKPAPKTTRPGTKPRTTAGTKPRTTAGTASGAQPAGAREAQPTPAQ